MKPSADALAVDKAVESELDTYLDTDSDQPASAAGAEASRPGAKSRAQRGSVRVPAQPRRAAPRAAGQPPATSAPAPVAPAPSGPAQAADAASGPAPVEPAVPDPRAAEPEKLDPLATGPAVPGGPALTDREQQILAFEQQWWRHAGAKEQAIRDAFGLSATRYYQILNRLLDNPAALAADPVLVGRLRRLRSARARTRRR